MLPAVPQSEISYLRTAGVAKGNLNQFTCKGEFSRKSLLSDMGYSDKNIADPGVPCRMADFDGNGTPDYWIYKCNLDFTSCQSKVLFMTGNAFTKSSAVPTLDDPQVFTVKADELTTEVAATLKKFRCMLPKVDALVNLGPADSSWNTIYVYDKVKNSFLKFSQCQTTEDATP